MIGSGMDLSNFYHTLKVSKTRASYNQLGKDVAFEELRHPERVEHFRRHLDVAFDDLGQPNFVHTVGDVTP